MSESLQMSGMFDIRTSLFRHVFQPRLSSDIKSKKEERLVHLQDSSTNYTVQSSMLRCKHLIL